MRPDAHAVAAAPAQQMSPSTAPQAMHIIAVPAPPVVVHRAPVAQLFAAQQIRPGDPQAAQIPAASQTAPALQLLPAQQGSPGSPHTGPVPPAPVVPALPPTPVV